MAERASGGVRGETSEERVKPDWQARRERVDASAVAILVKLREARGEWVSQKVLLDAQLRDDRDLVDVALSESISTIQHRLGIPIEQQRESEYYGLTFYRVGSRV